MKKEMFRIFVYYTNGEMTTIPDAICYDWSNDKFLITETSRGKVVVVLENVQYFTVREIEEEAHE